MKPTAQTTEPDNQSISQFIITDITECSLMSSLEPLGILFSSTGFDWLVKLESRGNLYMTG